MQDIGKKEIRIINNRGIEKGEETKNY